MDSGSCRYFITPKMLFWILSLTLFSKLIFNSRLRAEPLLSNCEKNKLEDTICRK